jgi:anti-sigma B factor antagonist
MTRVRENTVVPLLSRGEIGVPASGYREYLPAASLQMICSEGHLPNASPCWILRIVGGVDSRTSGELLSKIERLLGANHVSRLILDLGDVTHMDSSGVGALLAGLRDSRKQHVRFTLCGLRKSLRDMLERTRLAGLFEIRLTVEEALRR